MLDPEALEALQGGRNLLAFSAGVDSTALYHLLKARGIPFDLAMVNYKTRVQSDEEAAHAQKLADKDGKILHLLTHPLDPNISRFEAEARKIRYHWFEKLMHEKGYERLITAHQLDDMLEWHLMQLCRGAGCVESIGMAPVEERELGIGDWGLGDRKYLLVRPLLFTPKTKLLQYLQENHIRYFIDESNTSDRHTRNRFRKQAARFLLEESASGIAHSFRRMLQDRQALLKEESMLFHRGEMLLLARPRSDVAAIRTVDRALKRLGYLLSADQKEEIAKRRDLVVGGRWAVVIDMETIWIAPYRPDVTMAKRFKERCRTARIPAKIRPYLYESDGLEALLSFLARFSS